jgi:hypothetical protein
MPRNSGKRGTYRAKHLLRCVWCDIPFPAVNSGKKTCSGKCRGRLFRYHQRTGFDPLEPPGPITVRDALELLFAWLCGRESMRRELISRGS